MAAIRMPDSSALELSELQEECAALFPVPGVVERLWLYRSLAQIASSVPWLLPLLGDPAIAERLGQLEAAALAATPQDQRDAQVGPLTGAYGLVGAMVGTGAQVQPRGLLSLRGLLWIALRRCRGEGRSYVSSAEDLAAPLRSVSKSASGPAARALNAPLQKLRDAKSLDDAIDALDLIESGLHQGLFDVWTKWLRPILREIPAVGPSTEPPREPSEPRPPLDPPPKKTAPRKPRSGKGDQESGAPNVQLLRRRKPYPGQLPGEPPEEFSQQNALVAVPGYGTGATTRKQAEYRAYQAIWSGNHLHITHHIDSLAPDVFCAALNALVRRLEREDFAGLQIVGTVGCLLKSVSGRTTKGLLAMVCRQVVASEKLSSWVLDLDRGVIEIPVFWKEAKQDQANKKVSDEQTGMAGYYRPDETQRELLVGVVDLITLPLVRPIWRVLKRHRRVVDSICRMEEAELDAQMAIAADSVSKELGLPIGVAALRRSLEALLVERTGDSALAQLVCGDSFGATSAPQHYYAPRRKDLAEPYFGVIDDAFEKSPTPRITKPGERVGSELLVSADAAKRLSQASADHVPCEMASGDPREEAMGAHRRVLDHLVRMLLATTSHRPAEALFEITLADIDLQTGAALFRDKRHDLAHDPRLTCLPTVAIRQIRAYLSHLERLEERLANIAPGLLAIRRGAMPLLVDLDSEGCLVRPTVKSIADRGPALWNVLPWNWGRTYIRTRAVEMGASPFLVACQLGHYDAVGYPYSNQSPTDPAEVLAAVQPWLDRVAATQGWTVIDSELSSETGSDVDRVRAARTQAGEMGPLKDWRPIVETVERSAATAHRQWERTLRADALLGREEAQRAVLAHPDLKKSGVTAAYLDPTKAAQLLPMAQLDVSRIREELVLDCGDDAAAALARARALRRVLRAVAKLSNQEAPSLPVPIAVRRPLDNAFFAGSCLALSHVHALREHQRSRCKEKRPERTWRLQLARTAEALAIYGGIDDPDTLITVLQSRCHAQPSAKIPDLLLVPVADGRTLAIRGVASLALANLAQSFPDEPFPDPGELQEALAGLLPKWASSSQDGTCDLLARLCSAVGVANRFELSPAARFALHPERGCTHTSLAEQLAYIDSDPVGPPRPVNVEQDEAIGTVGRKSLQVSRKGEQPVAARAQYDALCGMVPKAKQDLELPLTSQRIPATAINCAVTRMLVVAEVDTWIARADNGQDEALRPIVRLLADWTRAELVRKKPSGEFLADKTVSTYLTRIGKALVQELGELEATQWDDLSFEVAYDFALFASKDAKHKVAAALLSFHRYCESNFDIPEVDLGPVYAALQQGKRNVDAAMILPVERDEALAELERRAWHDESLELDEARVARVADFNMLFLAHAGARLNEPLGMQVRDVGRRPTGEVWARIRSNRLRRVKTSAGRRLLRFGPQCEIRHHARALRWYESVRP
jgi:hypothetical protein